MDRQDDSFGRAVDRQLRNTGAFQSALDIRADKIVFFELLRKILIVIPARIPGSRHGKSESYRICFLSQMLELNLKITHKIIFYTAAAAVFFLRVFFGASATVFETSAGACSGSAEA